MMRLAMTVLPALVLLTAALACSTAGDSYIPVQDVAGPEDRGEAPQDLITQEEGGAVEFVAKAEGGDSGGSDWDKNYGQGCGPEERVGLFSVLHEKDLKYVVQGKLDDRVQVADVRVETNAIGNCRVMARVNPFCAVPCENNVEQCNLDEQCEPFPELLDAGLLTVTGLTVVAEVAADAGNNYTMQKTDGPLFFAGDEVEMTLSDVDGASLSLQGHGVDLLEIEKEPKYIVAGESLVVQWLPSDGPGEVHVVVSIGNHATSPVSLFCDADDDTSLTIPPELVDEFLLDWVEGASVAISAFRKTVDSAQVTQGCVEFQVSSDFNWYMNVTID